MALQGLRGIVNHKSSNYKKEHIAEHQFGTTKRNGEDVGDVATR
jgi:hypothetical protein